VKTEEILTTLAERKRQKLDDKRVLEEHKGWCTKCLDGLFCIDAQRREKIVKWTERDIKRLAKLLS
jgi:hypothetical protein